MVRGAESYIELFKKNVTLMQMKNVAYIFLALVALIGILNCALIEPAFAFKEEASHASSSTDFDCCFFHCSMHHQWISASTSKFAANNLQSNQFVHFRLDLHSDPVLGSIFRPPLAR